MIQNAHFFQKSICYFTKKNQGSITIAILPYLAGTPDGIRTHDLLLRRQLLYPTELPRHPYFLRGKGKNQIAKSKYHGQIMFLLILDAGYLILDIGNWILIIANKIVLIQFPQPATCNPNESYNS